MNKEMVTEIKKETPKYTLLGMIKLYKKLFGSNDIVEEMVKLAMSEKFL